MLMKPEISAGLMSLLARKRRLYLTSLSLKQEPMYYKSFPSMHVETSAVVTVQMFSHKLAWGLGVGSRLLRNNVKGKPAMLSISLSLSIARQSYSSMVNPQESMVLN